MEKLVTTLKEFVAIPSISSDPAKKADCKKAADYLEGLLQELGATTQQVQEVEGKNPVVIGKLGTDPDKVTLAIYGHYDVQPAAIEDGWDTAPFELTEKNGKLYGRGATDDKGPIIATLYAIKELGTDLPINLRFIYEGEEESGSGGFEKTLQAHKDWFANTDAIIIMDNYWLGTDRPCLTYGLRGLTYMQIEVEGPDKDLHSGVHGGAVREPLNDLTYVISKLVNADGRAQIAGFYEDVTELTEDEDKLYDDLEFDIDSYEKDLGVQGLQTNTVKSILMRRWRYPTLSIHGIEGAFSGPGAKTVIPQRVIGKVSMRLVPNQNPKKIASLFTAHVEQEFAKLQSPNRLTVKTLSTGDWWVGNPHSKFYKKAAEAIEQVWNMEPMYTREGGSIPITPLMEDILDAEAMMLPIGQSTDGAHSQNEKIRLLNLTNGKEVLKAFFNKF